MCVISMLMNDRDKNAMKIIPDSIAVIEICFACIFQRSADAERFIREPRTESRRIDHAELTDPDSA